MIVKTTLRDAYTPGKCNLKRWTRRHGVTRMGRTTIIINCPFCHSDVETFIWSLAGDGKRCTNQDCLAFFTHYGNAYRIK